MDRLLSMQVFEKVVAEGGFSAAARALDLSPTVVSRLISDLDERNHPHRIRQRLQRRPDALEHGVKASRH